MANSQFDVVSYHVDTLMPLIDAQLTLWQNMDDQSHLFDGIIGRGATQSGSIPFKTKGTNTYGLQGLTESNYNERRFSISVDQPFNNPVVVGPTEMKLYNIEARKNELAAAQAAYICGVVETDAVKSASFGGFRYFGRSQSDNETFSIDDLRNAMTIARNFSGDGLLYCYLPDATSTVIANTGYQQFLTRRNDETAQANELQDINGMVNARFFQTMLSQKHIAGSAARQELDVTAVSNVAFTYKGLPFTGTQITVTAASGLEVKENDVFTVIPAGEEGYFVRDDFTESINVLQGTIVADAKESGGSIIFVANVDLLSDESTGNQQTVTEPLKVGDKILIEGDHVAGFVFMKKGLKRASIMLGDPNPYKPGETAYYEDKGCQDLMVRLWDGLDIQTANAAMFQDGLFGTSAVAPYVMRLVLPLSTLNLYQQ